MFVVVPDVVGDFNETLREWDRWTTSGWLIEYGFELAFVAGMDVLQTMSLITQIGCLSAAHQIGKLATFIVFAKLTLKYTSAVSIQAESSG